MDDLEVTVETEPELIEEAGPLSGATRAGIAVALHSRDLRLLFVGQVVSQIGDSFLLIAMLTLVRALTSSTLALALIAASIGLPPVIFGLFAGVLVDRWDRRIVMLVADIVRGVTVLALLFVHDARGLPIMLVVGFVMGSMGVLFLPARNALLPKMVPHEGLVAANLLVEGSQVAALVIGPALGGIFVAKFGAPTAIIADSLTFLFSAVCIFFMRVHSDVVEDKPLTSGQLRHELMEGLNVIRHSPLLVRLIGAGATNMLALGAVLVLGLVYFEAAFGVDPAGFGILLSILGIGMIVGGALVATPYSHARPDLFVGISMALLGASLIALPFMETLRTALAAIFVVGMSLIAARSVVGALIQMNVSNEKLGRVEAANNLVLGAAYNLGFLASGVLGAAIDTRVAFIMCGVVTLIAGFLAFRAIRHLPSPPPANGTAPEPGTAT
ncbi:MAG: MFS transporter [Anaerolineae bacterium]